MFGLTTPFAGSTPAVSPLIQEARDRQRRRRLVLAQTAALAAVLGLAIAASHRGGGSAGIPASEGATAAQDEVRAVIAEFDGAVANNDFARACSLLDPWMGMTTVRTATNEIGARGGCEQRLSAFARAVGPRLVAKLERASVGSLEVVGSESRGFTAAGRIQVSDALVRENEWAPVVGVAKRARNASVLITCPPLLCASEFVRTYSYIRSRGRSAGW
jgi:hypothetical protein